MQLASMGYWHAANGQMGKSQHEMDIFNVLKSVISKLWNRYQQNQNVDDRPCSSCPRATTGGQDPFIRNQDLRYRSQTANQSDVRVMVRQLEINLMQPIFMLDCPGLCLA